MKGFDDRGERYAYVKYMLPCFVGMAVSKLRIATRSTTNGRLTELMMASITGSRAEVVGL